MCVQNNIFQGREVDYFEICAEMFTVKHLNSATAIKVLTNENNRSTKKVHLKMPRRTKVLQDSVTAKRSQLRPRSRGHLGPLEHVKALG